MPNLRLTYAATIPFTAKAHVFLCLFYIFGFAGLLIWNFLTSAKGLQCTSYASPSYDSEQCEPTPLEFARTYFTRPIANNAEAGSIGTFPWVPLGFGNGSNGPIDYRVLNLNWTADPLKCVMYEQFLVVHLDSEASTMNTCYYCGPDLRVLCSTVDSERSQIPDRSAGAYVSILDAFNQLSIDAHSIVTTAQEGATVGSVRISTKRKIDGLQDNVLPYNTDSQEVFLGTTLGSFPILSSSSNAGVATVARTAQSLSTLVEQATSLDLQPTDANDVADQRTLQVSYLCRNCQKRYKPTLEIIALLITGVFGVLSPAFSGAKTIAEWFSDAPQPLDPKDPQNIINAGGVAAAAAATGAGVAGGANAYDPNGRNSMLKPPASPGPPPMQHTNSYQMLPTQPYSPTNGTMGQVAPGTGGGPVSGPYPTYQQPYGQP